MILYHFLTATTTENMKQRVFMSTAKARKGKNTGNVSFIPGSRDPSRLANTFLNLQSSAFQTLLALLC